MSAPAPVVCAFCDEFIYVDRFAGRLYSLDREDIDDGFHCRDRAYSGGLPHMPAGAVCARCACEACACEVSAVEVPTVWQCDKDGATEHLSHEGVVTCREVYGADAYWEFECTTEHEVSA